MDRKVIKFRCGFISLLLDFIAVFLFIPKTILAVDGDPASFTVQMNVKYDQTSARNMLSLINDFRTGDEAYYWNSDNTELVYVSGLGKLTYSSTLEEAAMLRAAELILSYNHLRPNNTRMVTILPYPAGENIAYGYNWYTSYSQMFDGWKEDDEDYSGQGHRRNMLNPNFTSIGIAHVIYNNNYHFWVQLLGTTQDSGGTAFNGTKSVEIEVEKSRISSVSNYTVSPTSISVNAGSSNNLPTVNANLQLSDGKFTHNFPIPGTWTSANTSVAKIANSKVTGVSAGSTSISTTIYGTTKTVPVTVTGSSVTPLGTLTISQGSVLGTNAGITLTTARDKAASGYKVSVYDVDAKTTVSPTIKATHSSSTTTINITGSGMVNGHVYKLTIYKYDSASNKSNTVTVYGMPSGVTTKLTAQPITAGVRLNSEYMSGMDGVRYYIHDASTNTRVTKETLSGKTTMLKYTGLKDGQLYYAYARPYRVYNKQTVLGQKGKIVYFAPVAMPSGVTVQFTDATTAVISAKENSTARGVRVLYRELGGSLKNGCVQKGNQCSIGNLSQAKNYEFYLMHYNIINNVRHYGSGVSIQYTAPTASTTSRPSNAKIYAGNPTWTFTITKSSDAVGISVLYRINEGDFKQCCEKAGESCTKDLSKDQQYTFYIMQYKTVNGKKVYSPGITVKNLYGTKSLDGYDLSTEFVQSNDIVDTDEFYTVLEDYMTEEDLTGQEAFELLEAEEPAEYPDLPEMDFWEEEDEFDELPEEIMMASEDYDDFEPTEAEFIDVPVTETSAKGFGNESESDSVVTFYVVDNGIESDPYTPSFRTK